MSWCLSRPRPLSLTHTCAHKIKTEIMFILWSRNCNPESDRNVIINNLIRTESKLQTEVLLAEI